MWAVNCTIGAPGAEVGDGGSLPRRSAPSRESFFELSPPASRPRGRRRRREGLPPPDPLPRGQYEYAYAWLVGGVDGSARAHTGLLWGVLVAARLLRSYGSSADFVLYVRTSWGEGVGAAGALPAEDARLLRAAGVRTVTLDPPEGEEDDTFAGIVYEKFRPLTLLEYRRVMFLDVDIMPTVNLDYLFRLTEGRRPVLSKNFFYATRGEPCNTALFMMTPEEGAYDELKEIIQRQHEEGSGMDYPHFDFDRGWGHSFRKANDTWEAIHKYGQMWRFHAGHSDQGLWYYFVKYHRMEGSIAIGPRLQTITPGKDGKPVLTNEFGVLARYDPEPIVDFGDCEEVGVEGNHLCHPGYRDFVHFSGTKKPWLQAPNACRVCDREKIERTPLGFWHKVLSEMNEEYGMGLDLENYAEKVLSRIAHSPLGYLAQHSDHAKLVLKGRAPAAVGQRSKGEEEDDDEDDDDGGDEVPEKSLAAQHSSNADAGERGIQRSLVEIENGGVLLEPTTVAYAVSFIKCDDFQTHAADLVDASLILRHSIHKLSSRDPSSGSKYDYKMYAIVHRDAEGCAGALRDVGFEVVVVDPPAKREDIRGEFLRKNIHREWCCGSEEFVKLYAYALPAEIVVHVDMDFAFYKPMDVLFDSIRFDKDSAEGQLARSKLKKLLERPSEALPDKIDAFITRDWPQVAPNKFPPGFQAGFLVARRDPSVLLELTDIILEGNYTAGWGRGYGWGNQGYGGYVGAMAMQGLLAYYYDLIRPNNAVELNQCRFNHMGMDVLYRKQPNFRRNIPGVGGCRNGAATCEDCMTTQIGDIYSVHYTMCRKPWQCQATGAPGGKVPGKGRATAINTDTVHLDHCLELVRRWHDLRADFESKLYALTKDEAIQADGMTGTYQPDIFLGHCNGDGNDHYLHLAGSRESLKRSEELYDKSQ